MKKALVYFTTFYSSYGGSEYRPLLFLSALQKLGCDVTFALNFEADIAKAAEVYGVDLDMSRLRVVRVKPRSRLFCWLDSKIPIWSARNLKRAARHQDVCISCANAVDFGRPGNHFIYLLKLFGDGDFTDHYLHQPSPTGFRGFRRRFKNFICDHILYPIAGIRPLRKVLSDPREKIYVNSEYVARVMHEFYGDFNQGFFYPPTVFEAKGNVVRDPLKVIYIGRLTAMKGIREMILAVEEARRMSGRDLRFELAGRFYPCAYTDELKKMIAERPWLSHVGEKYGAEKGEFLLSGTYAMHACREEAFGISITEYLKSGVLPIVPDEGGSPEIAAAPELIYRDFHEAAVKLSALAQDDTLRNQVSEHCERRAALFTREAYFERQRKLFEEILSGS